MRDDTRVINYLNTAFSQSIGSMTGKEYRVALSPGAADTAALENPITWQQGFSVLDGPVLWIVAGKNLWEALGHITLEAAGIDEVAEEDCRSTWQEILNQTVAGVASAMTADQGREVTPVGGAEIDAEVAGVTWKKFTVSDGNSNSWIFKAGWTAELADSGESLPENVRSPVGRDSSVSKTFDLLLDVALPIAVSFGRTSLQIREVLKLNTGSIVELDRFVTDPVEVVVNNCVIARGEVVVVDGNYGVRINQLASREERLRSGMAGTMAAGVRQ